MAKQTTITIETDSLLILRGRTTTRAWCQLCAAEVEMIVLGNVSRISGDFQLLEVWLKCGALHRTDTTDGSAAICLNSLLTQVQTTKPADRR
jgi:hypothetical protein